MKRFMNSTVLSTAGVLAAGAIFAFALYSFYPSSDDEAGIIPVIKAEATPIRIEPSQSGGMDIPFRDSTVFDNVMSADAAAASGRKIENLLEPASGEADNAPLSKDAILAEQEDVVSAPVEDAQTADAETVPDAPVSLAENVPAPSAISNITESSAFSETKAKVEEKVAEVKDAAASEIKDKMAMIEEQGDVVAAVQAEPPAQNILEDVQQAANTGVTKAQDVVSGAIKEVPVVRTADGTVVHEPGSSPETLAFVRSVLDKKDAEASSSKTSAPAVAAVAVPKVEEKPAVVTPQSIEPAAGVEGNINGPKTHYVQLASIPDRSRADAEFSKLKSAMPSIPSSSAYRVQEANLGEKGTYFRIQAGPYSEAQAKSICDAIKSQKPGGCLVVR